MGEVYRARDTRLDRTVAIKILPAHLSTDPQFRERFEREARAISQLTHPHICTLHDVGEHDHTAFLVMEHLEGETLADRLKKGPLPIDRAIHHALEIASALEAAHRHGIVHRDLKPGNIMLTKSGAKLLDFGLAKVGTLAVSSGAFATELQTMASLTAQGTILGTFQYMAPEQLEGAQADARADIWAFGCVLYEMVTGRRAFKGKSQVSLIGAILEREPAPVSELQPKTPPALARLILSCLAKDPDERLQTAHDLRLQLQWTQERGSAADISAPIVVQRNDRLYFAWAASVLLAIAITGVATAWWLWPAATVAPVVSRFEYILPEAAGLYARWTPCAGVVAGRDEARIRRKPAAVSALDGSARRAADTRHQGRSPSSPCSPQMPLTAGTIFADMTSRPSITRRLWIVTTNVGHGWLPDAQTLIPGSSPDAATHRRGEPSSEVGVRLHRRSASRTD